MLTAEQVIALLELQPHPKEGGFFRETYRSCVVFPKGARNDYAGRSASTAIYYLLTPETFSAMHRLGTDEVFHFYAGDPVQMLWLRQHGSGQTWILGNNLVLGQEPQVVVPAGDWQGSRLIPGGQWALLGCTVAPGFVYEDYEHGDRQKLMATYPAFAEEIRRLT